MALKYAKTLSFRAKQSAAPESRALKFCAYWINVACAQHTPPTLLTNYVNDVY